MKKLNTYNEWDPLKEVIVGSAKNYTSHDRELSFDVFHHENLFRSDWAYPRLKKSTSRAPAERSWESNSVTWKNSTKTSRTWPPRL